MSDPRQAGDVRELLAHAVPDVGRLDVSTEAVYAAAARVRRRRRAAAAGAALLAAAVAAVVPSLVSTGTAGPATAAAPPAHVRSTDRAAALAALLPPRVGAIEQADVGAPPHTGAVHGPGPLDGQYAVRREGGVGYLSLDLESRAGAVLKNGGKGAEADLCAPDALPEPRPDCVREQLPDGRVLTVWRVPATPAGTEPRWGAGLAASLTLTDGQVLTARDLTGFQGTHRLGPLLAAAPLSRAELRALLLRPELLPGG